jgi:hypothetical protein
MLNLYVRTDKTQSYTGRFLGLHEEIQIPKDCSSAFDVICQRMEQRMAYGHNEQVMLNTILPPLPQFSCAACTC